MGSGGRLSIGETCKDHDIKALTRRDARRKVKTMGVKGEEKGGSHTSSMHTRVGICWGLNILLAAAMRTNAVGRTMDGLAGVGGIVGVEGCRINEGRHWARQNPVVS